MPRQRNKTLCNLKGDGRVKEILGGKLDNALPFLKINANKTYQSKDNGYQVWELADEEYEKLCQVTYEQWGDQEGWWRCAESSNMGDVCRRYNANHHYLLAWDGYGRKDREEENKSLSPDDRYSVPRKYCNLTEYFSEEIGVCMEKNICALSIDLAKQNGITLSELFRKYQG
ncbi:MAG: hypothetical protein K0R00_196 [Herbinix sp.]|nr:hypothetical protein [Herbinix sp.]